MASEGMLNIQMGGRGAASSLRRWERRWGGLEAALRVNLPAAGSDTPLHPHPHPAEDPQNLRWGRTHDLEAPGRRLSTASAGPTAGTCLCGPGSGPRGPRERGWVQGSRADGAPSPSPRPGHGVCGVSAGAGRPGPRGRVRFSGCGALGVSCPPRTA